MPRGNNGEAATDRIFPFQGLTPYFTESDTSGKAGGLVKHGPLKAVVNH